MRSTLSISLNVGIIITESDTLLFKVVAKISNSAQSWLKPERLKALFYLYVNNFYDSMWRLLFLAFPTLAFGQGSFNVDLLDIWYEDTLLHNLSEVRYNDCWGYTENGQEYALAGSTEGTHAFKISETGQFEYIDFLEGNFTSTMVIHRDIKTYLNYAYVVCDEGMSSLQIIDLSYLPDSLHVVMENDSSFARVHNLFIDEDNALMYACSIQPSSGGFLQSLIAMQVYSLADPELPVLVYEGPTDIPEVHDAYVRDNIAYLNCGTAGLRVYDFSTPTAPNFIQNTNFYQDQGYNHQGWLSPDGTKYVFGDESSGTRMKLCTVDANHNATISKKFGTNYQNGSVPHNIVISNEFAYVAYYNEGLRIFDLRAPIPSEIAYYDTYPIDEPLFKMQGAWGIYADFPSGRLLVSDRHTGLHLLEFNEPVFQVSTENSFDVYPNPAIEGGSITVKFNVEIFEDLEVAIYDLFGKIVESKSIIDQSFAQFNLDLASGVYVVRVCYTDYLGDEILEQKKIVVSE
ncbi:MAG: hypothetical protein ACJAXI_001544 [Crocinitomicaceae bacterium]|jgi:hypothetical protein